MIALEPLRSPTSDGTLVADSPHSLSDGVERWPVFAGIPYLRVGRPALVAATLAALDAEDESEALALLLRDRDEWDRTTPPTLEETRALARGAPRLTFRDAMAALRFGGVATYFAHRFGDPTFVAGLGLLAAYRPRMGARSFELACGAGHYLRELARVGTAPAGGDVVFAKLWLARCFIAPGAALTCFDAAAPWPIASRAYDLVHVHDALYFLPEKQHVAGELRRIGAPGATIAISHAHNAAVENLSVGAPLDRAGYAALFPSARFHNDAEVARAVVANEPPRASTAPALERAAAFAFVSGPGTNEPAACGEDVALPALGASLVRNPLYASADGTHVVWPSERYEREYAALATYPTRTAAPAFAVMSDEAAIVRFARTRELVALPERW